ncbi:hypothetical protein O4220_00230 [Rhodococcus ruber]|uniref:Integral membrane protein n=1 Tax=Rhodococcus ruber TaxID=1830 RepID=A0ABT4M7J2_9NOCA|nr:hypothetical protein [Rhodococcus ruber]MCZ4516922.1 hypothetical protein [Rhodococcus ruber]
MSNNNAPKALLRFNLRLDVNLPQIQPTMQTVVGAGAALTVLHTIPGFSYRTMAPSLFAVCLVAAGVLGLVLAVAGKRLNIPWLPTFCAAAATTYRFAVVEDALAEAGVIAGIVALSLIGMWLLPGRMVTEMISDDTKL